ncbi:MAG TPA: hypothetical protein VF121_08145 [Thermoanaerobaculia bacterium]|nr:hypothetical protein [Thermoanaerobaculia bacterium]
MPASNIVAKWISWAPQLLSVLRIVAAFIFIPSGTMKLSTMNGGIPAALFCFVFLYFSAAGPGPWSLDAKLRNIPASG